MAVVVTDLRCPTAGCGRKLAEMVSVTVGEIRIKCPRCRQVVRVAVGPVSTPAEPQRPARIA